MALFIKILIKIWPLKFSNMIIYKIHMKYLKNKSTEVQLSFLVVGRLIFTIQLFLLLRLGEIVPNPGTEY